MPFEDEAACLLDILDSVEAIQRFVVGMDIESFRCDEKARAAVERKLQVISEAAIRLGDRAAEVCPQLPWRDIRGIGNWLRHQYDEVDVETIWNTIQDDIPVLHAEIARALQKLKEK
ncbi:MAG TPA: HepT-like ribonuclease domain-containing protein [Terracidiphilus sp.]|nr:HepT-like ribonuclease domain-containing protein [Terracidiphilus sp.]